MYCGLCTEACPYQAIQAGGRYDDAVYVFDDMYRDSVRADPRWPTSYLKTTDGRLPQRPDQAPQYRR